MSKTCFPYLIIQYSQKILKRSEIRPYQLWVILKKDRIVLAEEETVARTQEARVYHRQERTDALDIVAAAGSLSHVLESTALSK